jgi:hypothetical protein
MIFEVESATVGGIILSAPSGSKLRISVEIIQAAVSPKNVIVGSIIKPVGTGAKSWETRRDRQEKRASRTVAQISADEHDIAHWTANGLAKPAETRAKRDQDVVSVLSETGPLQVELIRQALGILSKHPARPKVATHVATMLKRGLVKPIRGEKDKTFPRYELVT